MFMAPYCVEVQRPRPRRCHLFGPQNALRPTPEDLLAMLAVTSDFFRPHTSQTTSMEPKTLKEDKDKFQVNVDVQHFAPEEISVKTVDGHLVIEAKHEEKEDGHGFVSRSFKRRYALPEGINVDLVTSKLSSDGVLSVTAPLKTLSSENERQVPIVQTGPVKQQLQSEEKGDTKTEEEDGVNKEE